MKLGVSRISIDMDATVSVVVLVCCSADQSMVENIEIIIICKLVCMYVYCIVYRYMYVCFCQNICIMNAHEICINSINKQTI